MSNVYPVNRFVTGIESVANFIQANGSISIREAHLELAGMSGGSLTKYISQLRRAGVPIVKEYRYNHITGRKYARYYDAYVIAARTDMAIMV
jgi:hypothetical protein